MTRCDRCGFPECLCNDDSKDAEIARLAAEVARLESEAERIATNRALDARKASDAWAKMKRNYEDHVDDLTDQLEIERMRQVACMTIAGANTRESAKAARQMHDDPDCDCEWCEKHKDGTRWLRRRIEALRKAMAESADWSRTWGYREPLQILAAALAADEKEEKSHE